MEVLNLFFTLIVCTLCILSLIKYNKSRKSFGNNNLEFLQKNQWIIVCILIIIGFAVRAIYLESNPSGLNQDEASIGYDAFSLLKYGIDRNNFHNPVYFVAWGSGQNVLYGYLTMPLIALFGLNTIVIRIPALIFGTLSLLVFYLLIKEIWNMSTALIGLGLLIISPWHIMISRWALESNLLPAFLLFGTYFLVLSFRKSKFFIISMFMFGLSLYAYALCYIILPIYLVLIFVYILIFKRINIVDFIIGVVLLVIMAMPLFLLILINKGIIPEIITPLFSIPFMSGFRGSDLDVGIAANLIVFIKIILKQSDGLISNAIDGYGIFYLFSLPFIIIGFISSIRISIDKIMKRQFDESIVFIFWFIATFIMSLVTLTNINRENSIFIPLIYFCGLGILFVIKNIKIAIVFVSFIYLTAFLSFSCYYFKTYPSQIGIAFYKSLPEAINYASEETKGNIYLTSNVNMTYIYVLFCEKIPTKEFVDTVQYDDINAKFRSPKKFGRYIFGITNFNISKNDVYVIDNSSIKVFLKKGFKIKKFENYSVAY